MFSNSKKLILYLLDGTERQTYVHACIGFRVAKQRYKRKDRRSKIGKESSPQKFHMAISVVISNGHISYTSFYYLIK